MPSAGSRPSSPPHVRLLRRALRVPEGCALKFYLQDLFWKRVMRLNRRVPWPVHFTSQVVEPQNVRLGRHTFPGDSPNCYIQAINGIEIGDFTNIAPGVGLISANHDPLHNERHLPGPPLKIGKHCWIGMNAVILPGVVLGDYTVVGAGAVVTKGFPEGHCVIAGNPARRIRDLKTGEEEGAGSAPGGAEALKSSGTEVAESTEPPAAAEAAEPAEGAKPAEEEAPREQTSAEILLDALKSLICRESVVGLILRICLLLLLLIPAHDFFRVVLGRLTYPYEIEWDEGIVAVMGIRYGEEGTLSHLYADYDKGEFTPVLYAPLFPMLLSWLFKLFGTHLALGRLVSLLSVLGVMAGVVAITRHHLRRWWPGIVGALSFLMFFKASGFWYDLVRVDMVSYCLALWSAFLLTTKGGSGKAIAAGLILAYLTLFAKQTALFIPMAAVGFRFFLWALSRGSWWLRGLGGYFRRAHRFLPPARWSTVALVALFGLAVLGSMWYLKRSCPNFFFYLFEVPGRHHMFWERVRSRAPQELWQYYSFAAWVVPVGVWLPLMLRRWPRPRWQMALWAVPVGVAVAVAAALWIRGGRPLPHPGVLAPGAEKHGMFSPYVMRYMASAWTEPILWAFAASCGGLAVWLVRWLWCKTPYRGVFWLLLLFPAQHVCMLPWVKIGGYVNNFIPLFVVQSAALGIALGWVDRSMRARWARSAFTLLLCATVWVSWHGTREPFFVRPRLKAQMEKLREQAAKNAPPENKDAPARPVALDYHQYYSAAGEYVTQVYDVYDEKKLAAWMPWITDGLRYHRPRSPLHPNPAPYGNQLPPEGWQEDWKALMERLKQLQESGGVYLPHQEYLGLLIGIPYGLNVGAIRDVAYLGKPTPKPLLDKLREGHWRYVILMMPIAQDWLTNDFRAVLQQNYAQKEQLVPSPRNWESLMPRTGARVRPTWIYEYKGGEKEAKP